MSLGGSHLIVHAHAPRKMKLSWKLVDGVLLDGAHEGASLRAFLAAVWLDLNVSARPRDGWKASNNVS